MPLSSYTIGDTKVSHIPEHIVEQVEAAGKVIVTPKPWWQSKELWWNVVTIIVQLAGFIPQPYGPVVQGVGTVILRNYFTEAPIK